MARTRIVKLLLSLGCVGAAAFSGGCEVAAVATAGTVVGIAATAVSTGADVYRMGKLNSAEAVRFDDLIPAVRMAADDLNLRIDRESSNDKKQEWQCTLVDEHKSKINVTVQRRTETLCRVRIDVGLSGSEPTARLILARVRLYTPTPPEFEIPAPGTTTRSADDDDSSRTNDASSPVTSPSR